MSRTYRREDSRKVERARRRDARLAKVTAEMIATVTA